MREPRNPFRIRSAEAIEFEPTFLKLFGPGVLEVIPPDRAWNRVQIFSSAPGGGKTSLFRVFTPSSLLSLYDYRSNDEYKELFGYLKSLDAISDDGPLEQRSPAETTRISRTYHSTNFREHACSFRCSTAESLLQC